MGALGRKLRNLDGDGDYLAFFCPGCQETHMVIVNSDDHRPSWGFNGNHDKPTFTPSILVWRDPVPNPRPGFEEYGKPYRCHSFVTDGRIQFLDDCTHDLRGQTVDLPDFNE